VKEQEKGRKREKEKERGASRLPTLRLTTATHSSRWLEAFHCSSALSDWWSIATWANGCHSKKEGRRDIKVKKERDREQERKTAYE